MLADYQEFPRNNYDGLPAVPHRLLRLRGEPRAVRCTAGELAPGPIPYTDEDREFAAEHIEPVAADYYESGEYPREVLQAGMDAGLVAQDISEEYGGKGFDLQQMLAISEEFYRADAGIALTLQLASFGCEIVEDHGADWQKEEFLTPVAAGDQLPVSPSLSRRRAPTWPAWRRPPRRPTTATSSTARSTGSATPSRPTG